MRVLLDTHIFLWFLNGDKRLTSRALKHIDAADEVYVSAASVWEAAIKSGLGKLDAQAAVLAAEITIVGFLELPVRAAHSIALQNLPLWHRDPFDRMLLAQAISESLQLLTADVFRTITILPAQIATKLYHRCIGLSARASHDQASTPVAPSGRPT